MDWRAINIMLLRSTPSANKHRQPNKELSTKLNSLLLLLFNLSQQLVHSIALLLDAVAYEVQLRRAREIQREAELLANVRRCVLQSVQRLLVNLFVTGHCDVNARGAFVRREANVGNGYVSQSRVFEFVANNLRDLLPQRIRKSFRPMHNARPGAP